MIACRGSNGGRGRRHGSAISSPWSGCAPHRRRSVSILRWTILLLPFLLAHAPRPAAGHSEAPRLDIFGSSDRYPHPQPHAAYAEASPLDDESEPPSLPSARIIGGHPTSSTRYPYMASLQRTFQNPSGIGAPYHAHVCGGTLIHPDVVLTAAHCLDCSDTAKCYDRIALGRHDWRSYAELNAANLIESEFHAAQDMNATDKDELGRLVFDAAEIIEIKHPGYRYNLYANDIGNDFALLVLPARASGVTATGGPLRPVRINSDPAVPVAAETTEAGVDATADVAVNTAVEPRSATTTSTTTANLGTALTVAGWGATQTPTPQDNFLSPVLLDASVQYVPNSRCAQAGGYVETSGVSVYYSYWNFVQQSMLCAVQPDGSADACVGDSGGPLVVAGSEGDGTDDVQVGVVSFGVGCANADFPGIYARISDQWKWIREAVCENTQYPDLMEEGEDGEEDGGWGNVNFDCRQTAAPSADPSGMPSAPPSAPPSNASGWNASTSTNATTSNQTGSIGTPLVNDASRVEADALIPGGTNGTTNATDATNTTTNTTTTPAPTVARQGANPFKEPTNASLVPTAAPMESNATATATTTTPAVSVVPTGQPLPSDTATNSSTTAGPSAVPAPVDGTTQLPTGLPPTQSSSVTEPPSQSMAASEPPTKQPIPKPTSSPTASPVVAASPSPSDATQPTVPPSDAVITEKPSAGSGGTSKATDGDTSAAWHPMSFGAMRPVLACLAVSALLSLL